LSGNPDHFTNCVSATTAALTLIIACPSITSIP
jgi:hypothetical protein